jgi:hypothetical protein
MRIDPLIELILRLWNDLPFVVGDGWPAVKPILAVLLGDYKDAPDDEARHRAVMALEDWLAVEAPDLLDYLEAKMEAEAQTKGIGYLGGRGVYEQILANIQAEAPAAGLDYGVQAKDAGPTAPLVTRYTDIQLPARVQVNRRFAVIVGLTVAASPDSATVQPVTAPVGQAVRVVLAPSPGLELLSARARELRVEAERDSDPAVFFLRATAKGRHDLGIEFWIQGQLVASSRHSVEGVDEAVVEIPGRPAGQAIQPGLAAAAYPDLVLRVTTTGNRLHYDLHFGDVRFVSAPGEALRADPETYRYELIRRIEALVKEAQRRSGDSGAIERALAREGQNLYKELFSADLRREYRRFWRQVRTVQIISDEPWIPWELIKPYDDEEAELLDHDFLGVQFELARWFTPAPAPSPAIAVTSLAAIVPTDSKLAAAQEERSDMAGLARMHGVLDRSLAQPTRQAVLGDLLEGGDAIHLWHFACHGNFDGAAPADSPLVLENKERLVPRDIVGRAQTRLKRDRPLVVMNACRVGQSGLALTGLGGWAKVLVQDCGVGAYLAPMWEVTDSLARVFAATFYQATLDAPGATLAQAVRAARLAVRQQAPHDPTWLAYALYAHPNARLAWDGSRG